jgi:predicted ATPase
MVGRTQAVAAVADRVSRQRLVTIVGPGGGGKTVVAAAVAEKQSAAYEHGVCFVDFAVVTDVGSIPSTLAAALGLADLPEDLMSGILSFLKDKSMLIVFDNCEHVVEAAAAMAEKVLRRVPGVHLLATSREPLRAAGEYVYRLPPLEVSVPSSGPARADAVTCAAIQLFAERAAASLDSFELTDDDLPAVVEICRRLEGNPLAIELAAARVDFFGVRGLAARLDDCLGLLTRGPRTALPRHQSLRATLDWSYGLLSSLEQVVLHRLAVLPGRFSVDSASAAAVGGNVRMADVFDTLTNLVAKSLLSADVTEDGVLYRLSDATRAYAMEKLLGSDERSRMTQLHGWPEATNVIGWK